MSSDIGVSSLDAATILARVRSRIAREILESHRAPLRLGDVTLHPHQRRAADRITSLLHVHGGALLGDPTGFGKTFVALAVARAVEHLIIICPAALRGTWQQALERVERAATLISLERLSRGALPPTHPAALVIIDESHHFRNPRTKRYDAAAALCDRADVLLLSATPVQNCRQDLTAQLALFLGDAVNAMSDDELGRFVIRRDVNDSLERLPQVVGPSWISVATEDDVLDDILALPPAVPLADEGDAHALLQYTLLRQWSSSRAALVAGLRGRLARGVAIVSALDAGRRPTRQELAAWSLADDAVQLALPELLVSLCSDLADDRCLRREVDRHVQALRALLHRLRGTSDPDIARADALRELRRRHPGARVIAFSQYAQTVRELARSLMAGDGGVAELTAHGGRVAGGRLRRDDVLAQFAPAGRIPPRGERIDLLVTTDVSSEGLDLQMASVIVHLDLPWNPARLEQRVGRVRRLGSQHDRVFVYALAPPARSERVLDVEARLRAKLHVAGRLVGIGSTNLPNQDVDNRQSAPLMMSELYALLERWRDTERNAEEDQASPTRAAVRSSVRGCIALLADRDERLLVADDGSGPTLAPEVVRRMVGLTDGEPQSIQSGDAAHWNQVISTWWDRRTARERMHVLGPEGTRVRVRLAARIVNLLAASPRHDRPLLARRASAARRTLGVPLGAGGERRLAMLAAESTADESWLQRLAELGAARTERARAGAVPLVALIVLVTAAAQRGGE